MTFLVRVLVALAAIVFLISNGPSAYRTAQWWASSVLEEQAPASDLTSQERANELAAKGLREQIISFKHELEEIEADAVHRYYAQGVGQVTLNSPEAGIVGTVELTQTTSSEGLLNELPNLTPGATFKAEEICSRFPVRGSFNNVLLYDKKNDAFTTVFDRRVAVRWFQATCRATRPAIIALAAERDSNGDGALTPADDEVLFVFALDDKSLHRVAFEHMQVLDVSNMADTGYLLVRARVDRDKDGKFGGKMEEPITLLRVDLKTFEVRPFVPVETVEKLQRVLEGRADQSGEGAR